MPPDQRSHPLTNLWRLRGYLRPYAWQYVWVTLAGVAATLVSIVIPLIAQRVVDGPVSHRDPGGLWLLGSLASSLAQRFA